MGYASEEDQALAKLSPIQRAKRALQLLEAHRSRMGDLSKCRAEAIAEALSTGMPAIRIADELGITRQQVYRLVHEAGLETELRGYTRRSAPVPRVRRRG